MNGVQETISDFLSDKFGRRIDIQALTNLSGGCINNALKVETTEGYFFVKYNPSASLEMFEKERKGLELLRKAGAIRIPEVIGVGGTENFVFLMLEFLESAAPKRDYWKCFGESLANLHRVQANEFGLEYDNYIGSLPQVNSRKKSWVTFFIENRLDILVKKACDAHKMQATAVHPLMDRLYAKLPGMLMEEKPSLIHGDLWSGNVMTDSAGEVALIDPAVYFGNREIELAFTTLFGGFDEAFYESYHNVFPLEKEYQTRFDIYNLYPLLVHVNLFGGGYANSVMRILRRYA